MIRIFPHRFFIVGILFLIKLNASSQNYPIVFNDKNGLPSNNIYDFAEDESGKIWMTTENGVSCYNGYDFKNFGLEDGLPTLFSWELTTDSQSRIWLGNRQLPFTYLYKDSVYRVGDTSGIFFYERVFEDDEGRMIFPCFRNNTTFIIDVNNTVTYVDSVCVGINSRKELIWISEETRRNLGKNIYKYKVAGDYFFGYATAAKPTNVLIFIINTLTGERVDKIFNVSKDQFHHVDYFGDNRIYLSFSSGIRIIDLGTKKVSSYGNSLKEFRQTPVVIYQDKTDNWWLSDLKNGVFFLANKKDDVRYKNAVNFDENIVAYRKHGKELYLSSDQGNRIAILCEKTLNFTKKVSKQLFLTRWLDKDVINDGKGNLSFVDTNVNYNDSSGKLEMRDSVLKLNSLNRFIVGVNKCHDILDSMLVLGTSRGLSVFRRKNDTLRIDNYDYKYVFGAAIDKDWIYSVGSQGLIRTNWLSKESVVISENKNYVDILVLNNNLFARSEDGSITKFNTSDFSKFEVFRNKKDLTHISKIGKELWGVSVDKVVRLNPETLMENFSLDYNDGIVNSYKLGVEKVDSNYLVICNTGIYSFNESILNSHIVKARREEVFAVEEISINDEAVNNFGVVLLNSDENFIQINLACIYYPFSSKINFEYKLSNGAWNKTNVPKLNILNLPYGEYELNIKAFYEDGNQFGTELTIKINNPIPFYKSIWFIVLLSLFFVTLVFTWFFRRNRKKLERMNHEKVAIENREKMLQMQMKPHFLSNIFNSLNSSVLVEKPIQTSRLIKNVDNYLRLTLSASTKNVVSFSEEFGFIKKYVQLEKERVERPINLVCTDRLMQLEDSISLPVFILQPIVENSIWHGIVKSSNLSGEIIFDAFEEGGYYHFTITDNGIGFGNSVKKGNSIALKNIEERLSLFDSARRVSYVNIEEVKIGSKVKLYVAKKD